MEREVFSELLRFLAVAWKHSFTRAAIRLGTSQSTLSVRIRQLEDRLGLRLLNRTTRSVTVTEAGERLLATPAPRRNQERGRSAAIPARQGGGIGQAEPVGRRMVQFRLAETAPHPARLS